MCQAPNPSKIIHVNQLKSIRGIPMESADLTDWSNNFSIWVFSGVHENIHINFDQGVFVGLKLVKTGSSRIQKD